MKYEVVLPADIEQRLSKKASETGQDVAVLIQTAVVRFVGEEGCALSNAQWSEDVETRRRELIDMDIAGTIWPAEHAELAHLDRLANEHFDRVAPPLWDGARRLHEQLRQNRASQQ